MCSELLYIYFLLSAIQLLLLFSLRSWRWSGSQGHGFRRAPVSSQACSYHKSLFSPCRANTAWCCSLTSPPPPLFSVNPLLDFSCFVWILFCFQLLFFSLKSSFFFFFLDISDAFLLFCLFFPLLRVLCNHWILLFYPCK